MRYTTSNLSIVDLGRQGENLARTIEFDVSDMLSGWPGARIKLAVKRKYDNEPYLAETSLEGNVLYWPITYADTAYPGVGYLEIRAYSGDTLVKSVIGKTIVHDSLTSNNYKPPDPSKWWVDKVLNAAEDAIFNAETAAEAASLANAATARANTSADNANKATSDANTASQKANEAAANADEKATDAQNAAENANAKATAANTAAGKANTATDNANTAATNADTASKAANEAAARAENSAESAGAATSAANTAADTAKQAASEANTAANNAKDAAQAIDTKVESAVAPVIADLSSLRLKMVDGKLCVEVSQ